MANPKIDLHMHSLVSDGTDSPAEILGKVKVAGLEVFSLTDHDAIKGCREIRSMLGEGDPVFIPGAEFSCRDEKGKYHILGYGYDADSGAMPEFVSESHNLRIKKLKARLDFLASEMGIAFPEEERENLLARDNPGKPHIANLMVKYGYAQSKDQAFRDVLNRLPALVSYIHPEQAIEAITAGGGIPVLAHPSYGDGDQLILGDDMEERIRRLMNYGLRGLEAFYSGFTHQLRDEVLGFAERFDLFVTAGSDYHGANKMIELGDTGLDEVELLPPRLEAFLSELSKSCF
ncbi:MAG: PHP domain-containing protein [Spirochaetales bacterium]|nr:PHP domain-containing protein [Spirochaetales bacterium]